MKKGTRTALVRTKKRLHDALDALDKRKKRKPAARKRKKSGSPTKRRLRRPHVRRATHSWTLAHSPTKRKAPKRKSAKRRTTKRKSAKRAAAGRKAWRTRVRLGHVPKKAKKRTKRDPSWYGNTAGHRKAAHLGWRRKARKTAKRRDPGHRHPAFRGASHPAFRGASHPAFRGASHPAFRGASHPTSRRGKGMTYRAAMRKLGF
jgi:hypothetical protein